MNLLNDRRQAQQVNNKYKPVVSHRVRRWNAPPQGWVKINVDATIFSGMSCTGFGSVVRDETGQFVRARHRRREGLWMSRKAEAIGLKEAII